MGSVQYPEPLKSFDGLKLLITVVNRQKADFYADLIQSYGANIQLFAAAEGTAKTETLTMLGLSNTEKSVIFSVVRADRAHEVLGALYKKFKTIKNGKGVAFTVPFTSTVGVLSYRFLADKRDD